MQRVPIGKVYFNNVTLDQAIDEVMSYLHGAENHAVVTPNSEIAQLCARDAALLEIINSADLVVPDGIGVIYASRILGRPLSQKVAGIELAAGILPRLKEEAFRLFLLGGKPGIAQQAKEKIEEKYPNIICGVHDGYFKDDRQVIDEINQSGADMVFVCLGAPKQEIWMYENKDKLKVKAMLGLGGSLDVFAGQAKRAPQIFIKLGLEWLYRLLKEPWRIGRMMKLPQFLFGIIAYRFSKEYREEQKCL